MLLLQIEPPIHGMLSPLSMVCRTPYPWYIQPLTHGIVICYTWYLKPSLHGILNPLLMAHRTPYQKYCDPPAYGVSNAYGILTLYPCYFDPLPMVYRPPSHGMLDPYP